MLFDHFFMDRLKRTQSNVKRDLGGFDFSLAQVLQNLGREVKPAVGAATDPRSRA